ncbi:hypothetical protein VFPPC_15425 [Pochonia chlamydosporia 170]|uniref:Uncharacterized protein n=1 Tax=Pochonia chlamydosporia 170 TaxID=1380566 RepID=A0A179G8Q5_METCM|nr:hypothetical protein VFPPC_15425 [Pochonia chlamydosporia 170]OAQ74192.1 hypothetical protein VFPPC_15425 [Pochonia chlamydosporia 170]
MSLRCRVQDTYRCDQLVSHWNPSRVSDFNAEPDGKRGTAIGIPSFISSPTFHYGSSGKGVGRPDKSFVPNLDMHVQHNSCPHTSFDVTNLEADSRNPHFVLMLVRSVPD